MAGKPLNDGVQSGTVRVNDTEVYHEIRGSGPSVLLIPPGGWDAGIYEQLAAELAHGFTVVTYDRRANSRTLFELHRRPHSASLRQLRELQGDGRGQCPGCHRD